MCSRRVHAISACHAPGAIDPIKPLSSTATIITEVADCTQNETISHFRLGQLHAISAVPNWNSQKSSCLIARNAPAQIHKTEANPHKQTEQVLAPRERKRLPVFKFALQQPSCYVQRKQ